MARWTRRRFLRAAGLGAAAGAGARMGLLRAETAAGQTGAAQAPSASASSAPSAVASAPIAAGGANRQPADRPNIVLILADDLGYETLGCNGSAVYRTPALDELAAKGARFENCHAQPLCTPSRVQIMTGMYNFRNYTVFGEMTLDQFTFAHMLKKRGYATGIAGKWQLGGDGETVRHFGFDEHCLWNITGREGRYWNPRLMHEGKIAVHPPTEYGPDLVCKFVLDFIERHKDGPFLLYYPMVLTHAPYDPTPNSPDGSPKKRKPYQGDAGGDRKFFPDMVAYMDKLVGRVIAKLQELALRGNTLILFTGDNGTGGIAGRMKDGMTIGGGKGNMTDAGTRVPLVASWPGVIPPGLVSQALVDMTDFLPTLAEATGADLPDFGELPRAAGKPIDGKSFLPILKGKAGQVRDWIFSHYNPHPKPAPADAAAREEALKDIERQCRQHKLGRWARTQRYKLYATGQFYDVQADVGEDKDIPHGQGGQEAEAARKMLQGVLGSMPPWDPFLRGGSAARPGKAAKAATNPATRRAGKRAAGGQGAKARKGRKATETTSPPA